MKNPTSIQNPEFPFSSPFVSMAAIQDVCERAGIFEHPSGEKVTRESLEASFRSHGLDVGPVRETAQLDQQEVSE